MRTLAALVRHARVPLALAALAVGLVAATSLLVADAAVPAQAAGTVQLAAAASVPVGTPIAVTVTGSGTLPPLVVTSGVATHVIEVPAGRDTVIVEVPAHVTRVAGMLTVAPLGQPGAGLAVEVVPAAPVDPATPLVGQRSVVVGEQDAMVTVIPADHLGNPVAAGLPVTIRARRPDGLQDAFTTTTDGMLAWTWVPSGTVAGRTMLGAEAGPARGPAADLVEVPADPVAVTVAVEGGVPPADGRSTFTVRSDELRDRFGNLLPDGIHADLVVDGPTGRSLVAAQVVGGRVTVPVAVPDVPGVLSLVLRVDGVASRPLLVTVPPATAAVAATAEAAAGRITVRVGPVLDPRNGYLPDGTVVTVDGRDVGQLVEGRAVIDLPDDGRTSVVVVVAGRRADITVARP